jgi:hypothetical protein
MVSLAQSDEYLDEMRRQVCDHCIARRPGGPPCQPIGVGCGVEQHLEELISICRAVDSPLIDPYVERLHEEICGTCIYRDTANCPCPLDYLLPLAVGAVETVEERRRVLANCPRRTRRH